MGAILVLLIFAGALLAADGVVVSYDKDKLKLVVKIGDKQKTYDLPAKVHVHDPDDKEIKLKDRPKFLKKGTKVEIVEKDGKVEEINIKK
jgi:hypothetical protein